MTNANEEVYIATAFKYVALICPIRREAYVELHPNTARELGLKDGMSVYIETEIGRMKQKLSFNHAKRMRAIPPLQDLDARKKIIDNHKDYQQIISYPQPPIKRLAKNPQQIDEFIRIINDDFTELCAKERQHFSGWVAQISLDAPDAGVAEAERAINQIGALGVQIYANVVGKPIERPQHLEEIEPNQTVRTSYRPEHRAEEGYFARPQVGENSNDHNASKFEANARRLLQCPVWQAGIHGLDR